MLHPLGGEAVFAAQTMEVVRLLPDTWSPLANDIITWGAVIGAIGVLWRYIIKPSSEKLALLNRIWEKLQHEFEPNSGTSLRDTIDRTDLRVAELSDRFENLEMRLDRVDTKLTRHMEDVRESGQG